MIVWLLACLLCWISPVWTQEKTWSEKSPGGFSITATLPKTQVSLIDEVPLTVTLTFPDTHHVNLNKLRSHLLYHTSSAEAPFNLLSQKIDPPSTAEHIVMQKITYILDPQYGGKHFLTFLAVPFEPNDSKITGPVELISPILEITVTTPQENIEKPLAEPLMTLSMGFPVDMDAENRRSNLKDTSARDRSVKIFSEREIPWTGLLALAAALTLIFAFGKLQKKEKDRTKIEATVKEKALQELSKLQPFIQAKQFQAFYIEITKIVRQFIENYYHLEADSRTTEEFLNDKLVHAVFPKQTREMLKLFLEKADKVKYAQAQATEQDCLSALETARNLVTDR